MSGKNHYLKLFQKMSGAKDVRILRVNTVSILKTVNTNAKTLNECADEQVMLGFFCLFKIPCTK